MKYKAVCFDIDGTLYSKKTFDQLMAKFLLRHSSMVSKYNKMRKEFRKYQDDFSKLGLKDLTFREYEIAMYAKSERVPLSVAERVLCKKFYPKLEKAYSKLGFQEDRVKTIEMLKKNGIIVGVFSDWPLFNKLEQIGVAGLVDFATCSDEMGYLKPDARCIEYLMYNLKIKPAEVLYVGDSYEKDIAGARNAGVDAVLLEAKKGEEYPDALAAFENWKEFDSWLTELVEGK